MMPRNRLAVAGFMVAALAVYAFLPMGGAGWGASEGPEHDQEVDEALADAMLTMGALLSASPLKGLRKVEASLDGGNINSEWEKVLGVSPAQVDKHLKSRAGQIEGLDVTGNMLKGDPWLYLEIEPLVERSEAGEPTRVFVSVNLRLWEWVMVTRIDKEFDIFDVPGTTWGEHRLLSGPPVTIRADLLAAVDELLDGFERSYLESNARSTPPSPEGETD